MLATYNFLMLVHSSLNICMSGEGTGWMISAFHNNEVLGFGLPMSPATLKRVNEKREKAGMPPFSQSPGLRSLEFGKDKEGYWTMHHMLDQLKDYLTCAEIILPDFQLIHNFDWSSGHSMMPPNAMHANIMNNNFGGKQPNMRSSRILAEDGFLGPYNRTLAVGDVQHMVFQANDNPPWYAPYTPWQMGQKRRLLIMLESPKD